MNSETWSEEEIFFEGDLYYKDLLENIDAATESITAEIYIFENDALGTLIEEALQRAASRGVKIRLLVDGIGSHRWIDQRLSRFNIDNFEVRVFHPFFWGKLLSSTLKGFAFFKFLARLNRRDHRKVWLIDNRRAWIGSMNVSANHMRRFKQEKAWRDTAIRISGPGISQLTVAFEITWQRSYSKEKKYRRGTLLQRASSSLRMRPHELVRLNSTRRLRRFINRDLRRRINSSTTRIWITTPYFVPSLLLQRALIRAKDRGIEVRILVPRLNDIRFMRWVAIAHYSGLIKKKIEIFEYLPRFLHVKSILIDNWATVGTSNLNTRSFLHDLEVDIVSTSNETLKKMETQFLLDLEQSEKMTLKTLHQIKWTKYLGRFISFLFRHWI